MAAELHRQSGSGESARERKSCQDAEMESVLMSPYQYLCQVPGKQIRYKLARAFNYWLGISNERLQEIGEIIQMLHNASLMIDDIEDNSILRRGLPVAHSIFGTPSTINSANYVYFLAMQKTTNLGQPEATKIFTEEMIELHRGQGMELHWRDSVVCPSEDAYVRMVRRKTGGLFNLAVKLMQLFSTNQSDYSTFIDDLGTYFQIRDDYANLCSQEYAEKKCFAEDLTEGKFSFPIIHAINTHPEDTQIINILRQKPTEFEVKKYCVSLLEKFGSFQYTIATLKELEDKIMLGIEGFGGNPYMVPLLEELKLIYQS